MTAKASVTTMRTGNKQLIKKVKSDRATGGPKRPLNSWMAFRKYYGASLAPHTQKTISKVLTSWWREDPFEAKWAMLAKAYSIVRGSRDKEDAPLDEFFKIAAPLIAVIPPEEYQQRMGWQLVEARVNDEEKMPMLARLFIPDLSSFPESYTTTSLGVDDLVKYCYEVGYAIAETSGAPITTASGSLTMAVQPTATTEASTRTANVEAASMMPPLHVSPFDVEFNCALLEGLVAEAPAGKTAFSNATTTINGIGRISPCNTTFDPTNAFDISFISPRL